MNADERESGHGTKEQTTLQGAALPPRGIEQACDRTYMAKHYSGTRDLNEIRLIVMHDTEGDTAQGAAAWFANPASGGSAHLVVDDTHCFRTLTNDKVPWGAPGANTNGFHIEQAGYARWTNLWLSQHRQMLDRAAYKAAYHCRLFGIPPVFLTARKLRQARWGITTHRQCTKAFGGSHTDPGRGWPRAWFMARVRHHYNQIGP